MNYQVQTNTKSKVRKNFILTIVNELVCIFNVAENMKCIRCFNYKTKEWVICNITMTLHSLLSNILGERYVTDSISLQSNSIAVRNKMNPDKPKIVFSPYITYLTLLDYCINNNQLIKVTDKDTLGEAKNHFIATN
jgi:hypothetical protein